MCEPTTVIMGASLALTAFSTIQGMQSARSAGQAAASTSSYRGRVALNNQATTDQLGENAIKQSRFLEADALARGKIREQLARDETSKLVGRQRAVLAANGVTVDTDSALDLVAETAGIGEFDVQTIRNNAAREAQGFKTAGEQEAFAFKLKGLGFEREADLAFAEAGNARAAGKANANATLITGAASVASKWYSFSQAGAFSKLNSPGASSTSLAGSTGPRQFGPL